MVPSLWIASSVGDITSVLQIVSDAANVDIDMKDQNGSTPLALAVKNGHVEVIKVLLARGASPANSSELAQPEQWTSDPVILELLSGSRTAANAQHPSHNERGAGESNRGYYVPLSSEAYPYFPTLNSAPPPEGMVYYPPPAQPSGEHSPNGGLGNLPPPEVARMIPCRYFPACRYGPSCMFAHPQAPYFQGSLPPPAQYPAPYDPMVAPPYPPNYYGVSPASYHPPTNGLHPMSPQSAPHAPSHPGMVHTGSVSEISSPAPSHFSPTRPQPVPYPAMSPMSPSGYAHPGPISVPMSIPPLPPLHHPGAIPSQAGPQSPSMYSPSTAPFPSRPNNIDQYPTPPASANVAYAEPNGVLNSPTSRAPTENFSHVPAFRDSPGHNRRGSGFRRGSFGGARRPPCLFYPAGKCKNGDECRFPHVLPDHFPQHQPTYHPGRGGVPRPRGGHNHGPVNGYVGLAEKLDNMSIRDGPNGVDQNRPPHENGVRGRFNGGFKQSHPVVNGANGINGVKQAERKNTNKPQRLPQADEFPVLAGSTTPRARSPGSNGSSVNGSSGPTAAQVLQRPAPPRRDSAKDASPRPGVTPESTTSSLPPKDQKNGNHTAELQIEPPPPVKTIPSFATIASPATSGPSKAVSVSA